jgi:hypothetical protein
VTVDPGSIRDADQPAPVRVQGRGFDFMRSATVLVDGASVATADVGIDGTVDVPIRAVGLTCGPHVVTLVAGSSQSAATAGATVGRSRVTTLSATTTMQVTCESPGDPPVVVVPSVAASPAVVPRGRLVEISGARFAPGAVQIVVGGRPCAGATAVPDGTFSVTCVVHRLGRLDVTATAAGGSATTDVLGVPGPMEPGRHGFLVRR